jgi:opacity protein-like surface antigen
MRAILFALIVVAAPALAGDEDSAALSLADKTVTPAERGSDWRVFTEAALRASTQQNAGTQQHAQRLSFDVHYDKIFARNWRAVFADRLDVNRQGEPASESSVNTLKEAYLSWQPSPDRIADLGRINARYGVALGYNPTDFFRAGATRSIVSIDPASLRENRMGSAMLRGQTLWADGSLTALYSPRLTDRPNEASFNPDFGATNQRSRWLASLSHKLTDGISPQWLVYGEAGKLPQAGLNLTALVNDATVANFEWSAGRARSLVSQALALADDTYYRSRLATGLTYTTSQKISITLEYEYNGAGLDLRGWNSLRHGSPVAYARYRGFVANLQDLPTRQNLFIYASWQDALMKHLDFTAMVRRDVVDQSRLYWLEARYHWARADAALQWQLNSGQPGSNYGALRDRRILQALVRYFL